MATIDIPRLRRALAEEAAYNDATADEMARLAGEGCGPAFAATLRTVARRHRMRAIELRGRAAGLHGAPDA